MVSLGKFVTKYEQDEERKKYLPKESRVIALDGLRGIACLMVVCFHFFCETFGKTSFLMNNIFINFIFDGRLAVAVFFIISGDALSSSFLIKKDLLSILRPSIKRYPRLVIPTLISTVFIFCLIRFHFVYEIPSQGILNKRWIFHCINEDMSLIDVLRFSFLDVFLKEKSQYFNPFLWTMHYEAIGSIFIFLMLYTINFNRKILPILFVLTLFLFHDKKSVVFLLCFLFGYLLASLRINGKIYFFEKTCIANIFSISVLLFLFLLNLLFPKEYFHTGFSLIKAPLFTIALLWNHRGKQFLESRFIQFLGKISFPLFLFQYSVLISITSYLIVTYYSIHHNVETSFIIATSGVLFSIILAIMTSPMEYITKNICDFIYRKFISLIKIPL